MTGAVAYYIFYSLTWIVTLLPMRILYAISDLLFYFVYYFPGYRKKVVAENLENAFPEKTKKELKEIEKKFYHHFCDLFIEISAITHMSKKELMKRIQFTDPGFLDKLYAEDRDIALIVGHYGNWEWITILPAFIKHKLVPIYKPLNNKYFDRFIFDLRSKFGSVPAAMSNVVREIIRNRKDNVRAIYGFVADQTPPRPDIKYWMRFLNQDTPVYLGVEKLSAKYDMAVVFFNVQKIKRGYYKIIPEILFRHPSGLPEYQITQTHVKRLEEIIIEKPEYWLWSHRRWKHKRENPDG
jgi:KDO2-lipid IV(A) lauroyltransferase